MRTLIILECERYIQPFMRDMLYISQNYYDNVYIITNKLRKGCSIGSAKIKHIEVSKINTAMGVLFAPFMNLTPEFLRMSIGGLISKRSIADIRQYCSTYSCYGISFFFEALPIVKTAYKKGVCHILSCWFSNDAWTASLLKKRFPSIKSYSLAHSFEIDPNKNDLVDLTCNERKHKYLDSIFFISKKMREIYNETTSFKYYDAYQNQMKVSYLGLIKKINGINPYYDSDAIRIVSCSYVRKEKRLTFILDMLTNWKKGKIEWTHIGNGDLLDEIKIKAGDLMHSNPNITINFLGYLEPVEIQKYYSSNPIDIFINTSSSEGLPVSMMEAIAFGIPIFATNVGGVCEIADEKFSKTIDVSDSPIIAKEALEQFISTIKKHPLEIRQCAYKFWSNNFDAIKNYNKLFSSL